MTPVSTLLLALLVAGVTALLMRLRAARLLAEARGAAAADIAAARTAAAEAQQARQQAQADLAACRDELSHAQAAHAALERDCHWLRGETARQQEALQASASLLDTAEVRLRETFQSLAAEALHTNRGAFLDLARTSFEGLQKEAAVRLESNVKAVDTVVMPLMETLRKVETRLEATERDRLEAYSRLAEQITTLGSAAQTLSRSLRTPAVRGRWGEMQLRRVVETAGMLPRCDFQEQREWTTENGRFRPDMVVYLPGGRQIVVDAKTPLEAYLDAQECADDAARAAKLQAHARQVREHMDRLGSKAYWEQLGNSPELVVMFLPGETLFSAALQHDLTLIEYGLSQRVLLASPITLIALLTTIAHTWRQDALHENYREVARLGREFYERLTRFTEYFDDVRKKLDGAVQSYNQAAGSFESRVLVSARRLRELDVTTDAELPLIEPIDTVPRVLKHIGLMGLPEDATETQPS